MSTIRQTDVIDFVIANGEAESGAVDIGGVSGLMIYMPAAWTAASLGFTVCGTPDGDFLPLSDHLKELTQIDSPAVNNAYSAPPEVFAAKYIKLWSQNGSGSDTNQGAARTIAVTMKA